MSFLGTMVFKAKKTLVLVLIPGLFDRSRSRTVDTLLTSNKRTIRTREVACTKIRVDRGRELNLVARVLLAELIHATCFKTFTVSMGRIQGLSATLVSGHLAGSRSKHSILR